MCSFDTVAEFKARGVVYVMLWLYKTMKTTFCSHSISSHPITTSFFTCHYSIAATTCIASWFDFYSICWLRTKRILHRIWTRRNCWWTMWYCDVIELPEIMASVLFSFAFVLFSLRRYCYFWIYVWRNIDQLDVARQSRLDNLWHNYGVMK